MFQLHWDQELKELLEQLRGVELQLMEQHEQELIEIEEKLMK